ncbi:hypothetical protein [Glycomyces tritici]|uniref:Uncharacterized protein n=1 Tax=Glycomyces tritici TaxID=2665176 RepID=A0ABT7YQK2_9ACTN|nr:hypothetical protein [Glycomyces tritici]MDN3240899.1 hypothetical protein [Glycomyces tritici]MDN3242898.1 hypothetical protein [Glycomyces tritici]
MSNSPIMSNVTYRSLVLISALNDVGHEPHPLAIDGYSSTPMPSDEKYESSIERMQRLMMYRREPEQVVDFFLNSGWVAHGDNGLIITDLGRHVLQAHRMLTGISDEATQVCEVLNSSEDESGLPVTQLTRFTSEAGAGLLVDPYFLPDMLPWLLRSTKITRVLVKEPKHPPKKKAGPIQLLASALHDLQAEVKDRLEVRYSTSTNLHDRCIISEDKTVSLLGTSLTGIHSHLTVIYPLPSSLQRSYVATIEKFWKEATLIQPQSLRSESNTVEAPSGK